MRRSTTLVLLEPDSKTYARASRLIPSWIAARVTKATAGWVEDGGDVA
jgi:hypothetical protein